MVYFKDAGFFLLLVGGVYTCYLISAIFHEKLLKQPYRHSSTGQMAYCREGILFCIFPPMVAFIIGKIALCFQQEVKELPFKKPFICAAIINLNLVTYNMAVVEASFSAIVMAKSCSLLSVIIVGVFCSRVKDSKLKLSYKNLLIGVFATGGIILFNFFKKKEKNGEDKPLQLFSLGSLYLLISLTGDGFLPDFQAAIKSEYKPTPTEMLYSINKYTAVIGIAISVLTNRFPHIIQMLTQYEQFALDVLCLSVLNAVGQLFIYQMIKQFRQHIPAFAIAFRKCLTVLINIVWFNHTINLQQVLGIGLVFSAVLWQVYENQKSKKQKEELKGDPQQFQAIRQDPDFHENLQVLDNSIQTQQLENGDDK